MTREEAIKFAEYAQIMADGKPDVQEFYKLAESALRAQQEQPPCSRCGYDGKHLDAPPCTTCPAHPKGRGRNASLTLDELRKMDREPVWMEFPNDGDGRWDLIAFCNSEFLSTYRSGYLLLEEYGNTWLAYRQKPEEGTV